MSQIMIAEWLLLSPLFLFMLSVAPEKTLVCGRAVSVGTV